MINYTAKYTKIDSGYMGQLVEWPEVVTEGNPPQAVHFSRKEGKKIIDMTVP